MRPIFITGIGTGIGKTVVSAIVAEAIRADYWKPIQAGYEDGTDKEWVGSMVSAERLIHPELYKLKLPASPHIAARQEMVKIDLEKISHACPQSTRPLVIEGAGGLLVPLNEREFVIDLIKRLNARVVLVSRNYLGSINHSLLTAALCKREGIDVLGWIFNDQFMDYAAEIGDWSGYPVIASIPYSATIDRVFIQRQALFIRRAFENLRLVAI